MKLSELFEGPHDPNTFKAILMAGPPASGKSRIAKKIANRWGLKEVNVDHFINLLAKKHNINMSSQEVDYNDFPEIYNRSTELKRKRRTLFLEGNLGLVLDGTGRLLDTYLTSKKLLENFGYDVGLVFVDVELETAKTRNKQRATQKHDNRQVSSQYLERTHSEVQKNKKIYQEHFGENFFLAHNDDGNGFDEIFRDLSRFFRKPNENQIRSRR